MLYYSVQFVKGLHILKRVDIIVIWKIKFRENKI